MRLFVVAALTLALAGCGKPVGAPNDSSTIAVEREQDRTRAERHARIESEAQLRLAQNRADRLKTLLLLAGLGGGVAFVSGVGLGSAGRKSSLCAA